MTHHHGNRIQHPRLGPEMRRQLKLRDGAGADGYEEDGNLPTPSFASTVDVGGMEIVGEKSIGQNAISYDTGELNFEDQDAAAEQTVTTVVATVIRIIVENGSRTVAVYTVPTLPAVVSDPDVGLITVPARTKSLISITHGTSETAAPESSLSSPISYSSSSTQTSLTSEISQAHGTILPPPLSSTSTSLTLSSSSSSSSTSSSASSSSISTSSIISSSNSTSLASSTSSTSSISSASSSSSTSAALGAATSTQSGSSGSSGPSGVNVPKVVGGVVGGVGGALFLIALALLFLYWKKKRVRQSETSTGAGPGHGSVSRSEMASQRSSSTPLAAAGFFGRWRQPSSPTTVESTTTERGFQKVSGRKIQSVLRSGGDGYGDDLGEGPSEVVPHVGAPPESATPAHGPSSSSVRPYGGVAASSSARENEEEEGAVVMRPSPARTPVASSTNVPVPAGESPLTAIPPPLRPDALGRSHPSYDGSRGSRFTESI